MRANKLVDVFKHIDMSGGKDACWPWKLSLNDEGRPHFTFKGKKYLAYRLVWELVHGEELGKRIYRHKCDNPACCNPAHGIPGDHQENMNDMKERERHGLSKIVVNAIRNLCENGITHSVIASRYGLGRSTVTEICNKVNYAYKEDETSE